jgi:hypothetical protein
MPVILGPWGFTFEQPKFDAASKPAEDLTYRLDEVASSLWHGAGESGAKYRAWFTRLAQEAIGKRYGAGKTCSILDGNDKVLTTCITRVTYPGGPP